MFDLHRIFKRQNTDLSKGFKLNANSTISKNINYAMQYYILGLDNSHITIFFILGIHERSLVFHIKP